MCNKMANIYSLAYSYIRKDILLIKGKSCLCCTSLHNTKKIKYLSNNPCATFVQLCATFVQHPCNSLT